MKKLALSVALGIASCSGFAADWRIVGHDSWMNDKETRDTNFIVFVASPAGAIVSCEGTLRVKNRPQAVKILGCYQRNAGFSGYGDGMQFAYSAPISRHDNGYQGFYEAIWALDSKSGRVQLCAPADGCASDDASRARPHP